MTAPTLRFSEIVGHEAQVRTLRRSIVADRLHHAYLLVGPDGVGKQMIARALAAAVNCENPTDGEACGVCGNCGKIARGNFPDLVLVPPPDPDADADADAPKTARDRKRAMIKIDHVRELQAQARFAPLAGKRRVVLIDNADTMNEQAANALLKILEEPRPHTMFALVTSNPNALLPTIHSRCQAIHFAPLTDEQVAQLAMAKGQMTEEQARLVAAFAAGSAGRALAADLEFLVGARRELLEQLAGLEGRGSVESIQFADRVLSLEVDLPEALSLLRSFYRDVAVWQATADEGRLLHRDLADRIAAAAERMAPDAVRARVEAIGRVERRQANNQNKTYAIEALSLELADASLL